MTAEKKIFDINEFKEDEPRKLREVRRPKKSNKDKVKIKLRLFLYSTLVLTIAIVVLLRFAHISKLQYDLSTMETEISNLQKEKQSIALELSRAKDSRWIETFANNTLNMKFPDENQKVYVDLDE